MTQFTVKTTRKVGDETSRIRRFFRHPAGLPIVLFVLLIVLTAGIFVYMSWRGTKNPTVKASENYIVIVNHDNERQIVPTDEKTVGSLLKRMNITVESGDRVEPAQNAPITGDNFLINIYRSAPVLIVDGDKQTLVNSAAATPRSVVNETDVKAYAEDTITPELTDNFVLQKSLGYRVVIDRATPVSVQLYGKPLTLRTHATTVAGLLKEKGVKLSKKDTVRPALSTVLTDGMVVSVVRDGIQVVTIDEATPMPVQTIIDTSLSFGSSAVRQEGSPGKVTNTYQIKIENGVEVSRTLLQSVKVTDAVTRIIAMGNTVNIPADKQAVMSAAGISSGDYAYVDYIFSRESHWNAAAVSGSGKYVGLGQTSQAALSASCPSWQTDAVCQTQYFTNYATRRYGSWAAAYNKWLSQGWW